MGAKLEEKSNTTASYKLNTQYIVDELEKIKTSIRELENLKYLPDSIKRIETAVDEMKSDIQKQFVQKSEFAPIKSIVYGMVGMILTAFIGGLIILVFK